MNVFAARTWNGKAWHVVRFYDTHEAAEFFASCMLSESQWDIKEMPLDSANQIWRVVG